MNLPLLNARSTAVPDRKQKELALKQCPTSRALALVALGRNRACTLAKAMEGDRELRRLNALRLIRVLTVGLFQDLRCRNHGEPILVLRTASEELARN